MNLTTILSGVNYGLLFFFGVFLSVSIAGGCKARRDWIFLAVLCPVSLALQIMTYLVSGLDVTKQLCPLQLHLPLLAVMIFGLKRPAGISLVSVCTAYLCCQLPRCATVITVACARSSLAGEIVYTLAIVPIFLFLFRYFVPAARDAMAESSRAMLLFGILPVSYYVYDYTIAIHTNLSYAEMLSPDTVVSAGEVAAELLPTVVGLLYMVYATAYRRQLQQQTQAKLLNSMMAAQLRQAEAEMTSLRQADAQSAIYRHDMRHHLIAIDGFLAAGKPQQAREYIKQVQDGIEAVTPKRFCENELVNLLCSSFSAKAERMGVRLTLKAALPGSTGVSDTELCALLSNGLENALNAVGALGENRRWVELYCGIRLDKLLIEIKNPYEGQIRFRDDLPVSARESHGYGCQSIKTIVERNRGLCNFTAEDGTFRLRIMLPM